MLPPHIDEAIKVLADYAVEQYGERYQEWTDEPKGAIERLRAQVFGAVSAQVEDPDFEQAEGLSLEGAES